MLIAGLAASAAIDLVSQLLSEKPSAKSGTGVAAQSTFKVADLDSVAGASAQSQSTGSTTRSEGLSREALDTLLSAQGQAQRKKRSLSVLLDLMKSSQDGSVKKSDFEAAAGDTSGDASKVFDGIDQNHDSTVNVNELSSFLDSYRRASEAGAQGNTRTLALVA
jgi:hypothetical protein